MEGDQEASSPEMGSKVENRRGRPKATMIKNLILEGASSQSGIRCEVCSRVFPRDKSLQAHRRVHTGERPYSCDYPGCMRKFKQSGQLKTHQRLHTGERPFLCTAEGCTNRFTHANRHCQKHPSAPLTRCDDFKPQDPSSPHHSQEVRQWLFRYMTERREPKSEKKEKKSQSGKQNYQPDPLEDDTDHDHSQNSHPEERSARPTELSDMTNLRDGRLQGSPLTKSQGYLRSPVELLRSPQALRSPRKSPLKAFADPLRVRPVKNLFSTLTSMCREGQTMGSEERSPRKRELPKKRWLRIASREQEQNANQCRPTVLRLSGSMTPDQPAFRPPDHFSTPPYSSEKPSNLLTIAAPPYMPTLEPFATPPFSLEKQRRYDPITAVTPLFLGDVKQERENPFPTPPYPAENGCRPQAASDIKDEDLAVPLPPVDRFDHFLYSTY